MTIPSCTDDLIAEIEAAAKSFDNLDFDSNTNPFFNGPSGESMGGEADGTFCVYGEPFEIDGETYDGVTFVERCSRGQAKFIAESKQNILTLIARIKELEKDAARYRWLRESGQLSEQEFGVINEWLWADGEFGDISAAIDEAIKVPPQ